MSAVRFKTWEVPRAKLPTRFGEFDIYGFEGGSDGEQAIALVQGQLGSEALPLVRIHSQCLTGDILHSLRCDCGDQLEKALSRIADSSCGVLIYQMQEGRGIGLLNKLRAYQLQDQGVDTVEANQLLGFEPDLRNYSFCAKILRYFGIDQIHLMSNNPDKIEGLEAEGIRVRRRVPLIINNSTLVHKYLKTKKEKLGHLLD